jgi:hypothetical protein
LHWHLISSIFPPFLCLAFALTGGEPTAGEPYGVERGWILCFCVFSLFCCRIVPIFRGEVTFFGRVSG